MLRPKSEWKVGEHALSLNDLATLCAERKYEGGWEVTVVCTPEPDLKFWATCVNLKDRRKFTFEDPSPQGLSGVELWVPHDIEDHKLIQMQAMRFDVEKEVVEGLKILLQFILKHGIMLTKGGSERLKALME
jgi:hypothetical protein